MRKSNLLLLIPLFLLLLFFVGNKFLENSSSPSIIELNPSSTGGEKFILGAFNSYYLNDP